MPKKLLAFLLLVLIGAVVVGIYLYWSRHDTDVSPFRYTEPPPLTASTTGGLTITIDDDYYLSHDAVNVSWSIADTVPQKDGLFLLTRIAPSRTRVDHLKVGGEAMLVPPTPVQGTSGTLEVTSTFLRQMTEDEATHHVIAILAARDESICEGRMQFPAAVLLATSIAPCMPYRVVEYAVSEPFTIMNPHMVLTSHEDPASRTISVTATLTLPTSCTPFRVRWEKAVPRDGKQEEVFVSGVQPCDGSRTPYTHAITKEFAYGASSGSVGVNFFIGDQHYGSRGVNIPK